MPQAEPVTSAPPKAPRGRTFAVAIAVLGTLALGLVAAGGVAVVRSLNLPSELPPDSEGTRTDPELAAVPEQPAVGAKLQTPALPTPHALSGSPMAQPIPVVPVQPPFAEADRPGTIYDPEVLELVEVGVALRREGDTAGALEKLRAADSLHPSHPRILWELATVYKALQLREKAEAVLTSLRSLGALGGGEYYELARHSLQSESSGSAAAANASLAFGEAVIIPDPDLSDGEQVSVRLPIHSTATDTIDTGAIDMVMQFYDLVNGIQVEETRSDPPIRNWPTAPVDWSGAGTEIVEWIYRMPALTPDEVAAVGQRRYYGFVAKLYYRDKLEDVIGAPRTLLAAPAASPAPPSLLDDSLFPSR